MFQLTGKRSSDKNRGKTTNASHKRRIGQMPVFTTNVLPRGVSTTVDDNAHDDKDDNRDHLEQTEPVLKLTVGTHGNDVDADEDDPENETQRPPWEVVGPVLKNKLQGDEIRGCGDSVVEPVIPCKSKSKSIINKATITPVSTKNSYFLFPRRK
jgi:hypothetical protein